MQRSTSESSTPIVPDELLEVIVGTPLRLRIVETLLSKPLDRRDLADQTNVARTTLRHNLERLLEAGLLEQTLDNEYRVTARGRVTIDGVKTYRDRVRTGLQLEPFLRRFPLNDITLDMAWFAEAELTVAQPERPRAAGQRILRALESGSTVRGILPCLPGRSNGRLKTILSDTDRDVNLVVDKTLHEPIRGVLAEIDTRKHTQLSVSVTPNAPAYGGFVLNRERTLLFVLEESGSPHATVETESSECLAWLEAEIDELEATELEDSSAE